MLCHGCGTLVDAAWRWCPECGGALPVPDLPGSWRTGGYVVDWETDDTPIGGRPDWPVADWPLAETA